MSAKLLGADEVDRSSLHGPEIAEVREGEEDITETLEQPAPVRGKWASHVSAACAPVARLHRRTPYLNRVPAFVIFPITILVIINCAVWAIVGIILRYHP